MYRGVIGAIVLAVAAPASAETYFATVKGVVSSEVDTGFTAPGATSPIRVGDTITATFSYNTNASVGEALARSFGMVGAKKATFRLAGFTWSSAGDFGAGFEPVSFDAGPDPLANYYSTMDDAPGGGDLRVQGYDFEVGEFGYGLYTGPGFKGSFDPSTLTVYFNGKLMAPIAPAVEQLTSPAPEPATWAMMIAGFGLAGAALRSRRTAPLAA
jgi:hypothetical protein